MSNGYRPLSAFTLGSTLARTSCCMRSWFRSQQARYKLDRERTSTLYLSLGRHCPKTFASYKMWDTDLPRQSGSLLWYNRDATMGILANAHGMKNCEDFRQLGTWNCSRSRSWRAANRKPSLYSRNGSALSVSKPGWSRKSLICSTCERPG